MGSRIMGREIMKEWKDLQKEIQERFAKECEVKQHEGKEFIVFIGIIMSLPLILIFPTIYWKLNEYVPWVVYQLIIMLFVWASLATFKYNGTIQLYCGECKDFSCRIIVRNIMKEIPDYPKCPYGKPEGFPIVHEDVVLGPTEGLDERNNTYKTS